MDKKVEEKLQRFFKKHTKKSYKKGEYLIKDKPPEGVFFLTKGIVRMFSVSKDGTELTVNIFKPFSFFPVGWIINNTPNKYFFDALTPVDVIVAPKQDFKKFIEKNHDVSYDLLKRIFKGLDGYFMRMESLLSGEGYYRTVTGLLLHARRFGEEKRGAPLTVPLTHIQLAKLTGLTRETVTREMKKLQDKGVVTYNGKTLIVNNIDVLEEELVG